MRRIGTLGTVLALAVAVGLGVGFLPAGADAGPTPATGSSSPTAGFTVRGSVNQVDVIGAPTGAAVTLQRGKHTVASGTADDLGGYLFRSVAARSGYTVAVTAGGATQTSAPVTVMSPTDIPPSSFYADQHLTTDNLSATSGYGYITTRDGTTLSAQIVLPGPPDKGPYPTVVEYQGYDPSNPTTGQPEFKLLMPLLGYAWVGVNMRGTGCSGGAFNYFESLQSLDGYDAIETVAAQPWSTGRVGMVGISWGGISQLFVAATRPPHLDAITANSVIDDTYRGTLYPGGILNNGFALSWAQDRVDQNQWPNPNPPGWVAQRIAQGDTTCANNMLLRGQNMNTVQQVQDNPYWTNYEPQDPDGFPNGGEALAPFYFVKKITAPTLIAGAWQDEQTGGQWSDMLDQFNRHTILRTIGQNGTHVDSLDPDVLAEEVEFLDFYVAHQIPTLSPTVRAIAPLIWEDTTGVSGITFPPDRFTGYTSFAAALTAFQSEPPFRVLWDNGNAPGLAPGSPVPSASSSYSAWPPKQERATTWYLQPGGGLTTNRPVRAGGADSYVYDPSARPRTDLPYGNVWSANPPYNWTPIPQGNGLSYLTAPLSQPLTMVGPASANLWVQSSTADTDFQVTLSEVRPDGTERYVQNGWLRASHRKIDHKASTRIMPRHVDTQAASKPLPAAHWTKVRIEVFPFAYQFRAGSQIRLTVEAPGGDRPSWAFDALNPNGGVTNLVAHDRAHPSKIVFPLLPGPAGTVPGLPATPAPCPSLRAQPCRTYTAITNAPGPANAVAADER